MGGFNTVTGGIPDDGGVVMADRMKKRGLLSTLFGVGGGDPGAPSEQPVTPADSRLEDDKSRSPYGDVQGYTPQAQASPDRPAGDFSDQAPQMAQSLREQVAQHAQQPAQPQDDAYAPLKSQIQQMQGQYDDLNQPAEPVSLKQKILGFLGGPMLSGTSQNQRNLETSQKDAKSGRLLQEIQAGQRTLGSEQTADKRMTIQQQMENQREQEREAAQAKLFGQQNQLEQTRETARAQQAREAQQASDARLDKTTQASDQRLTKTIQAEGQRQRAQFGEQEKLQGMRQTAAQGKGDTQTREKVLTYWQPALDSAERLNVMTRNYEDATQKGDQQAMLSLLANHLGMTMGLQKGARLTKDIIQEAQQSAPWLQRIGTKFDQNGYLSGVTLSPEQMKQMVSLGVHRYQEDVGKARSMSGYIGVQDEPPRKVGRETVRQYLDAVGGDKDKTRQALRADGWTF